MSPSLETDAWRGCTFEYPAHVPTMIAPEERRYLYWLGTTWTGRGCVVEVGPWLGGSTVCLAAGMRDSGHARRGSLKVVDNFVWRAFMSERAPLPLEPGESFERFFLDNVAAHEVVECHRRALPDETIAGDRDAASKRSSEAEGVARFDGFDGEAIEILFIDGAKSWRGMRHLLQVLAPTLVPGASLLVCQDFKHWGAYWVPALMMRLREYLEPVHHLRDATTVTYRLKRAIPPELLTALEDHVAELPTLATLQSIEGAASWLDHVGDPDGARSVRLGAVRFLAHHGDADAAAERFVAIESAWPRAQPTGPLDRARAFLNQARAVPLRKPLRLRAAGSTRKVLRALFRA